MSDLLINNMFEILSYGDTTEEECSIYFITGPSLDEKNIQFSVGDFLTNNQLTIERNLFKEVFDDFKDLSGSYFFNGILEIQDENFCKVSNADQYRLLLKRLNDTQALIFKELIINITRFKLKTINRILGKKYTISSFNLSTEQEDLLAMNGIVEYHGVPV